MRDLVVTYLEHAPCGFLTFSDAGVITGINATLLALLGYAQKGEVAGRSIETLFSIAGRIFYQTHFFPLVRLHGHASEIFFSLRTKDKGALPVMCNAVRKDVDGFVATHCIFVPITERQKYEEELLSARRKAERALEENHELMVAKKELELHSIELDKQLSRLTEINDDTSQFSKVISHDLQESIRKIAVFSDMVSREVQQLISPERMTFLQKIGSECIRLRQLAADLDTYIGLNISTGDYQRLNMNQLVQNALTEATVGCRDISFSIEPLPEVEGNEKQMSLLFSYIFRHCMEHQESSTPLTISIECSVVQQNSFRIIKGKYRYLDFAKIVITDNANYGYEIEKSIFKLQKNKGDKYINFGLPFCKKIVGNHYGDIHMISKKGIGLETTILLPIAQNHLNQLTYGEGLVHRQI